MNAAVANRDNISVNSLAVNSHAYYALANVVGVLDSDIVLSAAELSCCGEAVPLVRNGRINLKAVPISSDSKNVLGDSNHIPCSSTCKPRVLALAET